MNLRQLQYLVAAADAGSVSGAARTLGVSQPVVSRALRNLEREYQVALFRLSGRSLGLTEAGRAVVTSARNALDAIEDVDRTAHRAAVGAALVLVSTPTNTALLSPILTQFVKNRPDTAVRLCRAGIDPLGRRLPGRLPAGFGTGRRAHGGEGRRLEFD